MKELKLLSLVLVAGTATLFTACTSESDNSPSAKISYETVAAAQQTPVTFDTYLGEVPVTRSGDTGAIDLDALKGAGKGFGVFGYYSDGSGTTDGAYDPASSTPDFMYNEHITWNTSSSKWEYSPIKYWPNEDNAKGAQHTDNVSFFAYAPYVSVTDGAASDTGWGITNLPTNATGGDPKVTYKFATNPSQSVDLMYGCKTNTPTFFVDETKQTIEGNVAFIFKHATARLGISLQGAFDLTTGGGTIDGNTRISVAEIELTGTNFKDSGKLNLNGGTWSETTALGGGTSFTISSQLITSIKDTGTASATFAGSFTGVTGTAINPVGTGNYFMLIPDGTTITKVKITYYVNTVDDKLNGGYSRIENVIEKNLTSAISVTAGFDYTINLLLGMTTVKVDASVSPWTTASQTIWLPENTTSSGS